MALQKMPIAEGESLLQTADVLHVTRLPKSTLELYVRQGRFPSPTKIGGPKSRRNYWPRSAIDQWIAERTAKQNQKK